MPTDGKCAICGHRAPVTDFIAGAGNGDLVPEFIKLHPAVQAPFYRYLALFRPASGCTCSDSKIIRLTREMVALVVKGFVVHPKKGRVDRPCPPQTWAQGMERMLEQAATLDLPLANHNYLRAVVYQLADQADAGREQQQRRAEIDGTQRVIRSRQEPEVMSETMRKAIAMYGDPLKKQGGSDAAE